MTTAATIDVRGLEHARREALIFPGLDKLRTGQSLRLVLEFNPVPLVHLLKARNEFAIAYEKEGPPDWILAVKRTSPPGAEKSGDVVELDLRPLHPFERHDRIFALWNALKPGQTLRLTNDHNPKPLRYQFEAEQKGLFEWTSEQEGPKDWIFAIRRLEA